MLLYGYEAVSAALRCGRRRELKTLFLRNLSNSRDTSSPVIQDLLQKQQALLKLVSHVRSKRKKNTGDPPLVVRYAERNEITEMCKDIQNQGIALACSPRDVDHIIFGGRGRSSSFPRIMVFPVELRDPTNLGSLARTCAVFGAGLAISKRNSVNLTAAAYKQSRGLLESIPLAVFDSATIRTPKEGIEALRSAMSDECAVYASVVRRPCHGTATIKDERQVTDVAPSSAVLVLGNEFSGLSDDIVRVCTHTICVPNNNKQQQHLDSLNVNVAAAVLLDHISTSFTTNTK
eukprot:PhM_4_TR13382/c0_g1_i1/m.61660